MTVGRKAGCLSARRFQQQWVVERSCGGGCALDDGARGQQRAGEHGAEGVTEGAQLLCFRPLVAHQLLWVRTGMFSFQN
jgi:hypothetical protein